MLKRYKRYLDRKSHGKVRHLLSLALHLCQRHALSKLLISTAHVLELKQVLVQAAVKVQFQLPYLALDKVPADVTSVKVVWGRGVKQAETTTKQCKNGKHL